MRKKKKKDNEKNDKEDDDHMTDDSYMTDDDHLTDEDTDEEEVGIQKESNDDEDKNQKLPSKCPGCNKITNNLLLHIRKKESCNRKIDPEIYENWKELSKKLSKRKYQKKYTESGKHRKVQKKYMRNCDTADRTSNLQVLKINASRYLNRERIKRGKHSPKKRLESFNTLCIDTLQALKQGNTPNEIQLNKFHLVEPEIDPEDKALYSWMKDIDKSFFIEVIMFQQIALMPQSRWESTLKEARRHLDIEVPDSLRKLVAKMQAYNHPNTRYIKIHENYRTRCKATEEDTWKSQPRPEKFSDADKKLLTELLKDIHGGEKSFHKSYWCKKYLNMTKIDKNLEILMKMV